MSPPMQQLFRNLHPWTEDSSEHSFVKKRQNFIGKKFYALFYVYMEYSLKIVTRCPFFSDSSHVKYVESITIFSKCRTKWGVERMCLVIIYYHQ